MHEIQSEDQWAGLAGQLKFVNGYGTWDVQTLVRLIGSKKAGARVIERIEQKLAENKVGHLPTKLPTDGTRRVLLYSKEHVGLGYILSVIHELALQDPADGENARVNQLESMLKGITMLQRATGRNDGRV
ncbi:hypothetical protein ABZT43_24140 [Streptomyces sp. NPDC005349]|uniref:hypothetical protein n=1 Tax=Streptomyces sp. NPDC005349 TaxID=3157037 RepID=UPI0033A70549